MHKRFLLLISLCLFSLGVMADSGFYESEPNDLPADFHPINGEVTLYGTMVGSDQDGYLWTVTDDQARKTWNFELHGEPGALTIVDVLSLEYSDDGTTIASKDSLFKMGTRDGAIPSILKNLMF